MKRVTVVFVVLSLFSSMVLAATESSNPALSSDKQKVSYCIGWQVGGNFKTQKIEIDDQTFFYAFKQALAGEKPILTETEMETTMTAFQQKMTAESQARAAEDGKKNIEEGKAFLKKNKAVKGVKVTTSGLQYKVINKGTGKSPKPEDTVTVNYEGKLLDGKIFDSSFKRGQPATFPLNGVIKGWTEGLQLMKEGAKYEFYIPSELAYGEQGAVRGGIGPNATLIFTVELIKVGE